MYMLQMNECYYYLLLLSFLSSLEQTISINLPNVTIQHVCEHDLLLMQCPHDNETIQIVRSMYGRTSQRICNQDLTNQIFYKTCANIEQSEIQTKLRCQGKSTCEIRINNSIYTDPCGSSISKHFEVHYRCVNLNKICLELLNNCSQMKDLQCITRIQANYSCQCPSSICEYNQANQLIGLVEKTCPEEIWQGIHWAKTLVNKGRHMSCPYPCTGQIFRFCQMNNHWSKPNTSDCQCPIKRLDRFSMHHVAHSYIFQCNFWLINRLLPKDKACILETDDHSIATCLSNAFENISWTSCTTFSIDWKNIGFEIFIPKKNEKKFSLPTINDHRLSQFGSNRIIIDRTESSYANLPMMIIDTKTSNSTSKSMMLIEQSNQLNSVQTANVTVVFNHRSSELRYQCRAYRSTNSSDMFFVCQLLCSNGSHIICQCPFYNPSMHYVLHLDTSMSNDDFELSMIDNDLNDRCSIDRSNQSLAKIDYYLKNFSSFNQKPSLAKKLLSFMDTWIDNETFHLIEQMEFLAEQLTNTSHSFQWIGNHLELFVNSPELSNRNQSVSISSNGTFFILSNLKEQSSNNLNSDIIHFNTLDNLPITFRHLNILNNSNQQSICISWKQVWTKEYCYLITSNSTHSICSCNQPSTLAISINFQKSTIKTHDHRLSFLSKITSIFSIICLIFTIIILLIRRGINTNDHLLAVRNILHINMSICLLIAQFLFLFSIDQITYTFICRLTVILLHYFLLATFSWLFVDGIELLIALKHLFKIDRIRILAYALYAYGFPLLITILSISLSTYGHYSDQHCWFSYDNPVIWTFGIPFVLLILTNIYFFILSIHTLCQQRTSSNPSQRISFSLRDISTLAMLFGLTWLIGLFYFHQQNSTTIFSYAFIILNFLQTFLVAIYYCLSDRQLQHFYLPQIFNGHKKPVKQDKSNQHYNTSSSGYSSAHSSEINKLDHRSSSFPTNPEYLTSLPIGLLSTFRYPTSTIPITPEQHEHLLKRYKIDLHHQHDDHQYYEIG